MNDVFIIINKSWLCTYIQIIILPVKMARWQRLTLFLFQHKNTNQSFLPAF